MKLFNNTYYVKQRNSDKYLSSKLAGEKQYDLDNLKFTKDDLVVLWCYDKNDKLLGEFRLLQ